MTLVFCPNDCGYFADFCPKVPGYSHSDVGHRVAPLQSPTVEVGVVGEAHAGPHVAPDVLDPALDLALGACLRIVQADLPQSDISANLAAKARAWHMEVSREEDRLAAGMQATE